MNLVSAKSLFLKTMIGCLIGAAGLAVITILTGSFSDTSWRALFTIVLVAVHCLLSFGFIVNNEKDQTFESLTFFTNVTFALIIVSFFTSVLATWQVIDGALTAELYEAYFVILFAVLHAEILAKMRAKQISLTGLIVANYVFMTMVVLMLLLIIFFPDVFRVMTMYMRILSAAAIVDATLTLIAVIMHKLYIQKHPDLVDSVFNQPQQVTTILPDGTTTTTLSLPATTVNPRGGMNIFVKLLVGYVILQIGGSLLFILLAMVSGLNN